jgi:hypothetical protein
MSSATQQTKRESCSARPMARAMEVVRKKMRHA